MSSGRHDPERDAAVDRHLAAAMEMTPDEQASYVAVLGETDPESADTLARLLEAVASPDPRLDPDRWVVGNVLHSLVDGTDRGLGIGDKVGHYTILGELGRGGMSVVYLGERSDGLFDQRVALKFLRFAHEAGLRRFDRERRILAELEHPNIARLLDGGTDTRGHPYIVMEYVEGKPIDAWCDESSADLNSRLQLFLEVADAVEYAHRNLVVHRDIKPSNILVTDAGQVKLLDFGIAKLLEHDEPPDGGMDGGLPITGSMVRILTPDYASPEQVRGSRITTSSDVYGLGVLLYELLVGRRPFRLGQAGAAELERVVCQQDPVPPSRAAAAIEAEEPTAGGGRVRGRQLRGDLDRIVLKALAKEPERRYASVADLREDLVRFRTGLPVRARPATLGYRAGRFVSRHRAGIAATGLVMCALVMGLVAAGWQAMVAAEARDRAEHALVREEAVSEFLVEIFEVSDPEHASVEQLSARELLDRGARRLAADVNDPAVSAALMGVVGRAYRNLGLYDDAEPLLVNAVELHREGGGGGGGGGEDAAALAVALADLGQLRLDQRRLDEASPLYEESLQLRSRAFGPEHSAVADGLRDLAALRHLQGESAESTELSREVLEMRRRLADEDDVEVARAHTDLGRSHLFQARRDSAEVHLTRAVEIQRSLLPVPDAAFARSLNHLGQVRHNQGRLDEAVALYEEAHSILNGLLGPDHPTTADVFNNIGTIHYSRGDRDAALEIFAQVLASRERSLPQDHPLLAHTLHNLASAYRAVGRFDEAEEGFLRALEIRRAAYGDEHREVAMTVWGLGLLNHRQGRLVEADRRMRDALVVVRSVLPDDHPWRSGILLNHGDVLADMGRSAEALARFEEAFMVRSEAYGPEDRRTVAAREKVDSVRQSRRGADLAGGVPD